MNDDEKWSSAAFVAISDTLAPEEMRSILGLEPTRSHRIGEPRSTRSPTRVHDRHYFSVQSTRDSALPLEEHIGEVVSLLEPKTRELEVLATEAELCLFCGFSSGNGQGGCAISPKLLNRLSKLSLELILDLYPPETVEAGHIEIAT